MVRIFFNHDLEIIDPQMRKKLYLKYSKLRIFAKKRLLLPSLFFVRFSSMLTVNTHRNVTDILMPTLLP